MTSFGFLEPLAAHTLPSLLQLSAEVAAVATLVALVIAVFHVRDPGARHLLWLLVLLKPAAWLLLSSPWTLFSLAPVADHPAPTALAAILQVAGPSARSIESPPQASATRPAEGPGAPRHPAFPYSLVAAVWLAGVLAMVARLAAGVGATVYLQRSAQPVRDGPVHDAAVAGARRMGLRRLPTVALTATTSSPTATGIFRHHVLIPTSLSQRLGREQLELVLMHEMAHVRRRDNLVLLLQRLAECALFFHPAVWICGRELRREAEGACDDAVLAAKGHAVRYADGLTCVAETITQKRGIPAMNVLAATEMQLTSRVRRILAGPEPMSRAARTGVMILATVLTASCLPSTAARPAGQTEDRAAVILRDDAPADTLQGVSRDGDTLHVAGPLREDPALRILQDVVFEKYREVADSTRRRQALTEALALLDAGAPVMSVVQRIRILPTRPATIYYYGGEGLSRIQANPAQTNAQRFVVASLQLGFSDASGHPLEPKDMIAIDPQVKPFVGLIRSITTEVLSRTTVEEFEVSRQAVLDTIRQRIADDIVSPNLRLPGKDLVLGEVIFTDFVIQ